MTNTSVGTSFPVMKGSSLQEIQRSFNVLHEIGSSSLELQLTLGGSVHTFDKIIEESRSKSKEGSRKSERVIDDHISPSDAQPPSDNVASANNDSAKYLTKLQIQALMYLKRKKIFELFNFFTVQLLSATPDDPIEFLNTLLNQCLCVRSHFMGRTRLPLLFTDDHVKNIFDAFDQLKSGYITREQYKEAMKTMGFVHCTDINEDCSGQVSKTEFVADANQRLIDHIHSLIQPPNTS